MDTTMRIPLLLAPFFQEYDLAQLDLARSRFTIIERVLQFGDRQEIRWLFTVYPKQEIKEWVSRWGMRRCRSRTAPSGSWCLGFLILPIYHRSKQWTTTTSWTA